MAQPLVSILVPRYNSEKYLRTCLQSLIDQTYPNCEIIVIDDGSTDGSLKIIQEFKDQILYQSARNLRKQLDPAWRVFCGDVYSFLNRSSRR